MEEAAVQKDVGGGLPDAQTMNHRVRNQTKGLNDQVIGGGAAEQNVGEGLQQKNAGTNQYDQLDAGSDEAAPIEIAAARSETGRHKRSVRPQMQRRQSAVSMTVMFVDECGRQACADGQSCDGRQARPRWGKQISENIVVQNSTVHLLGRVVQRWVVAEGGRGCQAFGITFVEFGGREVVAGRHDNLDLGGFGAVELILDGGEGAEEQAGDVGESSGATGGDVAAGEQTKEMGEGRVLRRWPHRKLPIWGALRIWSSVRFALIGGHQQSKF